MTRGDELAAADRVVAEESRRAVPAHPQRVGAKTRRVKRWQHRIPGTRIVRPAMREDHREAAVRACGFEADAQQRSVDELSCHRGRLRSIIAVWLGRRTAGRRSERWLEANGAERRV